MTGWHVICLHICSCTSEVYDCKEVYIYIPVGKNMKTQRNDQATFKAALHPLLVVGGSTSCSSSRRRRGGGAISRASTAIY